MKASSGRRKGKSQRKPQVTVNNSVDELSSTTESVYRVVKMMDEHTKFFMENVSSVLQDQMDFCVVGVLGKEGVGKSTILNGLLPPGQERECYFGGDQRTRKTGSSTSTTLGIDLCATPERFILLDSQPTLSLSIMANRSRIKEPYESNRAHEIFKDHQSYASSSVNVKAP